MSAGRAVRAGSLLIGLVALLLPLLAIGLSSPRTLPPTVPTEVEVAIARPVVVADLPARPEPPAAVLPTAVLPVAVAVASPTPLPQAVDPYPRWRLEDNLNFLLIGVDRRSPDEIYRTDTVMLANVDLRTRQATVISIPRDLVVSIPGFYQDRINSVYALGETEQGRGYGLKLLRDTVERNFGLRVHHYATVDFNCYRGVIDALGGVTVTVPERIYDPQYPTDDYGYKTVVFNPGVQRLNGERALEYARTRYSDSDFGRMRRQQQIVAALRERALQVGSLGVVTQVASSCGGMTSDLNLLELVSLGASMRDIRAADISFRVIDETMASRYIAPSGADVLLPRWESIRAMLKASLPTTTTSVSARG
jgi:LCP family protein required for cell wall assembly